MKEFRVMVKQCRQTICTLKQMLQGLGHDSVSKAPAVEAGGQSSESMSEASLSSTCCYPRTCKPCHSS